MIRAVIMLVPCCLLGTAFLASPAHSEPPIKSNPSVPLKLTSDLLRRGSRLQPPLPMIEANICSPVQLGLVNVSVPIQFQAKLNISVPISVGLTLSLSDDCGLIEEAKRRNLLLSEQNQLLKLTLDCQIRHHDYEKQKHDGLMRKPIYTNWTDKPDQLVVIVADFSSGHPTVGAEVADEIANQLAKLKEHGIDISIMVGEIKPGVVIRSEEMARDLGQHFPPGTSFVVIWGTMSPRTMGQYRPHITTVQKSMNNHGISNSFTIDLDPASLPLDREDQGYQRECYERLIGSTCAAIPGCYAAHEISREQIPDLRKYYEWLGEGTAEVQRLKDELKTISQWAMVRKKSDLSWLHRVSAVSAKTPFPTVIYNNNDQSVMVLLTDPSGKPIPFPQKDGPPCFVYMDVAETTNRQYIDFLNARKQNGNEGGTDWVDLNAKGSEIRVNAETGRFEVTNQYKTLGYGNNCPVVHVSWYGANAYCVWAGKSLPTCKEWEIAAGANGVGPYPWGTDALNPARPQCNGGGVNKYYAPVGVYVKDKSRVGCFDMGGNVSEWVLDWWDENKGQKTVCGGCCQDSPTAPTRYQANAQYPVTNVHRLNWVGFRGVIRIPVEAAAPTP